MSSRYIERGPHTNKLSRKNSGRPIGNFLVIGKVNQKCTGDVGVGPGSFLGVLQKDFFFDFTIKIFNPKKQKTK